MLSSDAENLLFLSLSDLSFRDFFWDFAVSFASFASLISFRGGFETGQLT
jgi:hypothetical protein